MMAKALKAAADELLASVMETGFRGFAMGRVYKGGTPTESRKCQKWNKYFR
jgi:hypothetical protein